jgi:hypothetical protein
MSKIQHYFMRCTEPTEPAKLYLFPVAVPPLLRCISAWEYLPAEHPFLSRVGLPVPGEKISATCTQFTVTVERLRCLSRMIGAYEVELRTRDGALVGTSLIKRSDAPCAEVEKFYATTIGPARAAYKRIPEAVRRSRRIASHDLFFSEGNVVGEPARRRYATKRIESALDTMLGCKNGLHVEKDC